MVSSAHSREEQARDEAIELRPADPFHALVAAYPQPDPFFHELLRAVGRTLEAACVAVWLKNDAGRLEAHYNLHIEQSGLMGRPDDEQHHGRMLDAALAAGTSGMVLPHAAWAERGDAGNPTDSLVLLAPIIVADERHGLIEVFVAPTTPAAAARSLQLVSYACQAAGEMISGHGLRVMSTQQALWVQLETFSRQAHRSLDVREVAFTIVNEGRRILGCDRVSIARWNGSTCKITAVSGQDVIEPRANIIRKQTTLAETVLRDDEAIWYWGDAVDLPPQVETALHDYLDEAHAKFVGVVPLRRPPKADEVLRAAEIGGVPNSETLGALIVEQFTQPTHPEQLRDSALLVAQHGGMALANAHDYHALFLLPLWRGLGQLWAAITSRFWWKVALAVGLPLAAVALLFVIPADLNIESRGVLEPADRRDVFAAQDGVVEKVHVEHGQRVREGQLLVELKNTDLNVALADTTGRLNAAWEQIHALERARSDARLPDETTRVSGELAQTHALRRSLERQLDLLEQKKKQLQVTSPIAGQVATWQVHDRLAVSRPVQRGQTLLTVADPDGDWELELWVSDKHIAYLTRAQQANDKVPVRFKLASTSGATHNGTVRDIHTTADVHGEEGNTVLVRVSVDKSELTAEELRPGVSVTAKVLCGRTSVADAWFHDAWAWVRRTWFKW